MAKAREYKTVRERAIALWMKEHKSIAEYLGVKAKPRVYKARSRKTITVGLITWSYKGGTLRRIA